MYSMDKYRKYLKLINGSHNPELEGKIKEVIDYYFDYAKRNKMSSESKEDIAMVKDSLTEIFNLELELYGIDSSEIELKFSDDEDFSGNFSFARYYDEKKRRYVDDKCKITINLGLAFEYINYGTRSRLFSMKGLLNTLLHELEHFIQYKRLVMNMSSPDNLMFTKEFIYSDLLDDYYDLYKDNHDSFSIESDAKRKSNSTLVQFLDFKKERAIEDVTVRNVDYHLSGLIVENDNKKYKYNKTDYINYKTDSVIEKHLELLDKFPILKKEYNEDGSKKTINSLVISMYKELSKINSLNIDDNSKSLLINDMCNMYYELIYRRLDENDEIMSSIKVIGKDNFKMILDSISEYYRQKRIELSNLSKRKYDIKTALSHDSDYLSQYNNYLIEDVTPQGIRVYDREEYIDKYVNLDDIPYNLMSAIINRFPKEGYYILHNGSRVSINEFIRDYLKPNINPKTTRKELLGIYKTFVKPSIEEDYRVELETINSEYQTKRSNIDRVIEEYILSEEFKL